MKKKIALMGIAAILVLTAMIGGTLASLNTTTEDGAGTGVAQLKTKTLTIAKSGTTQEKVAVIGSVVPGSSYVSSYNVTNGSLEEGYSFYAKVTLYKSWSGSVGTEGEAVNMDASISSFAIADASGSFVPIDTTAISSTATPYVINGWIVAYADAEQVVLYYTKPLAEGEASTNYLDAITFDPTMNNAYADRTLNLDIKVQAVQSDAGDAAMVAEWGMFPLIDSTGNLINVFETEAQRNSYQ